MNSQIFERKLSPTLLGFMSVFSILAMFSLAISYRPVADDYQQVINVVNLGSVANYQEIRNILDSSLLGSFSYYVIYEFLANTTLKNWSLIIFLQFLIITFLIYLLIVLSVGLHKPKTSKWLFVVASLTLLIFSCFGSPQKSYMTFTWTASFFAHTVPELLMYILGLTIFLKNSEKIVESKIIILAVLVSLWGAIDPIISFLTIAPLLIWKIVMRANQSDKPLVLFSALKFYGSIFGVMLSGVIILVFGPSTQRRVSFSELQSTNSGDFFERLPGIALLAFRENVVSNVISILLTFLLGVLVGVLKTRFKLKADISWSVIAVLLLLLVFRKLVVIGVESFSYFGVWHHGTTSVVLLVVVFLVAFKVSENWKFSTSKLALTSILFLGGQVALISDIDLQSNAIQDGWNENKTENLKNCAKKSFKPNHRFSNFLESPKTFTWQEMSCGAGSNFDFNTKPNLASSPSVFFKIQKKLNHLYDVQILSFVDDPATKDSLERHLY